MTTRWWHLAAAVIIVSTLHLQAGDLDFSDPANQPPIPPGAVGYPSRDPNLDVLPGFQNPPPGLRRGGVLLVAGRSAHQGAALMAAGSAGRQGQSARCRSTTRTATRVGRAPWLTYASDPPLFLRPTGGTFSAGS